MAKEIISSPQEATATIKKMAAQLATRARRVRRADGTAYLTLPSSLDGITVPSGVPRMAVDASNKHRFKERPDLAHHLGGTVLIVVREVAKNKLVFSSVRDDDERADQLLDMADRQDGQPVLGKMVALYCLNAASIPEGNVFGSAACGIPANKFAYEQLVMALDAQTRD